MMPVFLYNYFEKRIFFQPYFSKGINMDRDGVETGPEVKVPIYTYRKLASKHANFIWIQMKLRFHIKIINLKFLVPFKCFDFYIYNFISLFYRHH